MGMGRHWWEWAGGGGEYASMTHSLTKEKVYRKIKFSVFVYNRQGDTKANKTGKELE
jgi:hypothetical protein